MHIIDHGDRQKGRHMSPRPCNRGRTGARSSASRVTAVPSALSTEVQTLSKCTHQIPTPNLIKVAGGPENETQTEGRRILSQNLEAGRAPRINTGESFRGNVECTKPNGDTSHYVSPGEREVPVDSHNAIPSTWTGVKGAALDVDSEEAVHQGYGVFMTRTTWTMRMNLTITGMDREARILVLPAM